MPRVLVAIPCFNHGRYIDEAVDSVLAQTFQDFEIVVVDDGSTDPETVAHVSSYRRPKTRVVRTENRGPSAARNVAIELGTGDYVLPLDADDRIGPTYLETAVKLLDADPRLGIVYCDAEYFGARTGRCELPPVGWPDMLWDNAIFASAVFRRSDWSAVGGFRTEMIEGWEDWDFWISLLGRGCLVHRINEPLFFYRISDESRNRAVMTDRERGATAFRRILKYHRHLYTRHIADVYWKRWIFRGNEDMAIWIALTALTKPWPLRGIRSRTGAAIRLLSWGLGEVRRARAAAEN